MIQNNSYEKTQIVINADNLETLKQYPDNFFDAVVTDPPYGLGKEPNANEMLQAWITDGYMEVTGAGFMGKNPNPNLNLSRKKIRNYNLNYFKIIP
jgi:DNA modification methylase